MHKQVANGIAINIWLDWTSECIKDGAEAKVSYNATVCYMAVARVARILVGLSLCSQ